MIGATMSALAQRPVLVTIPISHYCEKARWALERAAIDYEERAHLPALHRVAVRRAGGGLTAPVLVCEDGVIGESSDIVAYADTRVEPDRRVIPEDPALAAEARALSDDFDRRLGPHTRRWVYFGLRGQRELVTASITAGVSAWQRRTLALTYRPINVLVHRILKITPETVRESEAAFRQVFAEVGERLADGRRHLVGERFSIADLTFAALAAPLVIPAEYGVPLPAVDRLPPEMSALVREHQAHPAGRHALAMFREERRAPAAVGASSEASRDD
ncbi:MAG: Glutathione S-transferase family protein [Conexibacter sp.]|nr:Glutathione S-transferase family protein [Conexibacter sp.]